MAFAASFKGVCPDCLQEYAAGTLIKKSSVVGPKGEKWGHAKSEECVKSSAPLPVEEKAEVVSIYGDKVQPAVEVHAEEVAEAVEINPQQLVANLIAKMESLESSLSTFKADKIDPLNDSINEIGVEKEELFAEFQKKNALLSEKQQTLAQERNQFENEFNSLQAELRKLQQEKAHALELLQAQQKMDALAASLREIFEESTWGEYTKDYQYEDLMFMANAFSDGQKAVLNANVMGAGKTFESAAFVDIFRALFRKNLEEAGEELREPRILWLTNKSLINSSARELYKWMQKMWVPVVGGPTQRAMAIQMGMMGNLPLIANYEAMNTTPELMDIKFDLVMMDEVHKLKGGANANGPTKIFLNAKKLVDKAEFIIMLTGTPIQNKVEEMWAYMHLGYPMMFPSLKMFQRQFCYYNGERYVAQVDRLLKQLKGAVIRQDPDRIRKEWPSKRVEYVFLEMTEKQRQEYDKVKMGILDTLNKELSEDPNKKIGLSNLLQITTRLWQMNVWPKSIEIEDEEGGGIYTVDCDESSKIDEAVTRVAELWGDGERSIVWSARFNAPLYELKRRLNADMPDLRVQILEGKNSDKHEIYEQAFQQGEIDVLLANRSAGTGLNLQKSNDWPGGASNAIFLDAWWNPAVNEQMEDRIWRTGQTENVTIYYLYNEESIDNFIAEILRIKTEDAEGIMGSDMLRPASEWASMLEELL